MGETVDVVYPNGRVRAQGRFAGIDIWGRATVVLEDGSELEFAAAESQIRG
jgi:BirA family biotin operon repressor/biotin-[acetyl-CoA-carboxylase] ligase